MHTDVQNGKYLPTDAHVLYVACSMNLHTRMKVDNLQVLFHCRSSASLMSYQTQSDVIRSFLCKPNLQHPFTLAYPSHSLLVSSWLLCQSCTINHHFLHPSAASTVVASRSQSLTSKSTNSNSRCLSIFVLFTSFKWCSICANSNKPSIPLYLLQFQ